jgi:predicted dehydrogenase
MNVCVVGAGYWGPNLVRNFLSQKEIEKVYVCDLDENRLKQIQQKFPMIEIESDYSKILKNKDIEAVAIATPVSSHYILAKQALENKKHTLVEKPMTSSSKESQELLDIATKNNLILMVDHTFIYTSAVAKMKELVDNGTIGDITYFDSTRINLGLFQHDVNVVWDLASHDLSIMLHLMKERPITVLASGIDHLKNGLEDIAYITLFFEENTIAHFHLSWMSPVKIRKTIVGGTKKMVVYDDMESDEKIKIYDKGINVTTKEELDNIKVQYRIGDIQVPVLENKEALSSEMAHFIDCIKTRKKPRTSGEYGLWVVKVLEAAEKSIKENRKIDL